MNKFNSFLDKKDRQRTRELGILAKVFEKNGFAVRSFLKEDDPYVYVATPNKSLSFGGIRIYKIGDNIAYRVQREESTHPYGKSYALDVEDMYNDLLADEMDEKKAGEKVIKNIKDNIKKFFENSEKAEKDERDGAIERDSLALRGTGGSGYSNQIYSKVN